MDGENRSAAATGVSRRGAMAALFSGLALWLPLGQAAHAKTCIEDCALECNKLAKGAEAYCADTCADYCKSKEGADGEPSGDKSVVSSSPATPLAPARGEKGSASTFGGDVFNVNKLMQQGARPEE